MSSETLSLLADLSNEMGPSGDEGRIRQKLIAVLKPLADDLSVDTMGNLYATKKAAKETDLTVMIAAHMDEVGFMITKITGDGMLKFETVGGFDPRILPGKTLLIGKDKITGVIGLEAIHFTPADARTRVTEVKSLAIDIGASSKESASAKVSVGDYAVFDTKFDNLNQAHRNGDGDNLIVKGKALDDRVGCTMLVEILKETYPVNIVGAFTVQEEIGLRGAKVAAHKINPDFCIVFECTTADDLPSNPDKEIGYPRMGDGPCLTLMDRSYIPNRQVVRLLEDVAQTHELPYQYKKPGVGGTDAGAIHRSRAGIPSVVVAPAARYIHGPAALLDLGDFWNAIELVKKTLNALPEKWPAYLETARIQGRES